MQGQMLQNSNVLKWCCQQLYDPAEVGLCGASQVQYISYTGLGPAVHKPI